MWSYGVKINQFANELGVNTSQEVRKLVYRIGEIVGNEVGSAGRIDNLISTTRVFSGNLVKSSHFVSAVKVFKNTKFSIVGRNLTKHPRVLGFESTEIMRASLNTEAKINEAAKNMLRDIMKNGDGVPSVHPRYGNIIEYRLDNGFSARFYEGSNEMIGFIEP